MGTREEGRGKEKTYLDTGNTGLLSLADLIGCDALVKIKRHEVVHLRVVSLESLLVLESLVDGDNGAGSQVGHDEDGVDAGLADGGGHQLGDGTRGVAQVDVHVRRGGEEVGVLEGHCCVCPGVWW